jgi:hypothetical protein
MSRTSVRYRGETRYPGHRRVHPPTLGWRRTAEHSGLHEAAARAVTSPFGRRADVPGLRGEPVAAQGGGKLG